MAIVLWLNHPGKPRHDSSDTMTTVLMAPDVWTQRRMGLRPPQMERYTRLHGGASQTHPFGDRVHEGLLCLAMSNDPSSAPRRLLWVFYGSQPNKTQMMTVFGTHQLDANKDGRWFPATGNRESCFYRTKCIGQEWNLMPSWWIHESRVQELAQELISEAPQAELPELNSSVTVKEVTTPGLDTMD